MHIDAEFALRDTDRCDSKKMLHDPTNDNFSVFFFFFVLFCFVLFFFTLSTGKIGIGEAYRRLSLLFH